MITADTINSKGQVSPSFINLKTGEKLDWDQRHNTISYSATKAMAHAFGGDITQIPNRIGIIYGPDEEPSFMPITRNQTWNVLKGELADTGSDIQIQPFSSSPTLKPIEVDSNLTGYAVTFRAHSDSSTPGFIGKDSTRIFDSNMHIFHAVLLNETSGAYTIIARVSLENTDTASTKPYNQKPKNFELALDWTIKFF